MPRPRACPTTPPPAWWSGWRTPSGWPGADRAAPAPTSWPPEPAPSSSPGTALTGAPWLAIAVADRSPGRRDARVRAAVAIDEATALEAGAALHTERDEVTWRDGDVSSARVERLGAIVLTERPLPDPDPADVAAAVAEGLRLEGLGLLHWTPAARAAARPAGGGTRRTRRSVAGRRRRGAARRDRRVAAPAAAPTSPAWTSSRPCVR